MKTLLVAQARVMKCDTELVIYNALEVHVAFSVLPQGVL